MVGAASRSKDVELLSDWGGVVNSGPVTRGPIRLADLYKIAAKTATKPIKVSVGAGPVNLAWHTYFCLLYTSPARHDLSTAGDLVTGASIASLKKDNQSHAFLWNIG